MLRSLMARVLKLSGEVLATYPADLRYARELKTHLSRLYVLPESLQQLVQDGCVLDDAAELDASRDVQLVLLPVSGKSYVDSKRH